MQKQGLNNWAKIGNRITALLFVLLTLIPLIGSIYQEDELISTYENRNLNTLPAFPSGSSSLKKYPDQISDYYADHFGYRSILTGKYFDFIKNITGNNGIYTHNSVTKGRGDWLFYGSPKVDQADKYDVIRDAINVDLFAAHELADFARVVSRLDAYLNAQGIQFIYMIAPNKHTIYFDKLPSFLKKLGPVSSTDQLVTYLQQHTDVEVVDVREELFERKSDYQLYFKQDTHWNYVGANFAQQELVKSLAKKFPDDIVPMLLNPSNFTKRTFSNGDLARAAQIKAIDDELLLPVFYWPCIPEIQSEGVSLGKKRVVELCTRKKLNALIYRDSFFDSLMPFISRQFFSSTYISDHLNIESFEAELKIKKPDVVIYQIIERKLPYIPNIEWPSEQRQNSSLKTEKRATPLNLD